MSCAVRHPLGSVSSTSVSSSSSMRRLSLCLLIATAHCAAADSPAREPWTLVRQEAIRSHVDFLASDLLEGSAAASRGYDIAAAYVAAQFRQSGLAPPEGLDGFFQPVPLLEAT